MTKVHPYMCGGTPKTSVEELLRLFTNPYVGKEDPLTRKSASASKIGDSDVDRYSLGTHVLSSKSYQTTAVAEEAPII